MKRPPVSYRAACRGSRHPEPDAERSRSFAATHASRRPPYACCRTITRNRYENIAVARARAQSTATAPTVACRQLTTPGCEPTMANTTVPSTDAPVASPICSAVDSTPPANPARSTGRPASTRPTRGTITAPQPNPTTINGPMIANALSADPPHRRNGAECRKPDGEHDCTDDQHRDPEACRQTPS